MRAPKTDRLPGQAGCASLSPMAEDDDRPGAPPCFQHELIGGHPVDPETWRDVARFRRAERTRLYAARTALGVAGLRTQSARIMAGLGEMLGPLAGRRIAVFWPIRAEPDLRDWMAEADRAGAEMLLPVVVEKDAALIFRRWRPGVAMTRGQWNIPVPETGAPITPDLVIAPLLGLDGAGYRLGNGGGYYDRTLAGLAADVVGVGFSDCRIKTIFPQPWDIPMQRAMLGSGERLEFPKS